MGSGWHAYTAGQALRVLETDRQRGLTQKQAEERLGRYGPNELEQHRQEGLVGRVLAQLRDPMILVLLAAVVVAVILILRRRKARTRKDSGAGEEHV